tara:strand:- start:3741 stop:5330 length:1590 start_codon:yes stop_codon:yes gene_type:complete
MFLLGVLLGCNDITLTKIQDPQPEIVVLPEIIDFGNIQSGHETGVEELTIVNAGDEVLLLDPLKLIAGNDRFSIDHSVVGEWKLEPGEGIQVDVYYEPQTYEGNGGLIEVVSNDDETPQIEVLILGRGDAPVMTVSPSEFDYGTISMGCDNEERITIRNDGNLPLTIDSVTQMVTQPVDILMEFGSLAPPPWVLDPNQEVDFLVSYIPGDTGLDDSAITVRGDDPLTPEVEVIQYGEGVFEQFVTQTHVQEEIPILDIIFVIDNSGSMSVFQQELSNQMTAFMNVFLATGADFHLGFITTDRGYLQCSGVICWIDDTFATPVDWAQGIISQISIGGSAYEKGIEMAHKALQNTDYDTGAAPGTSFWRNDATLVIIYVSDEPDFSLGTWTAYTNFFDALKPNIDMMRHFGVIGDYPQGCLWQSPHSGYYRNVGFGSGYYHMTQRYTGDWYSICATDWGNQMQDLANTVTVRSTFELEEDDPIEASIVVTVNGQTATGWTYDPLTNAVVFDENSIPEPSQTIIIEYGIWGC